MADFLHVAPDAFLHDSFRLGRKVYDSGFRPKHVISIWRGGTPVGLGVDAFFRTRGVFMNHTTIATESYSGVREQGEVTVKGLEHLIDVVCPEDGLLIVDDVLESGRTIQRILEVLAARARANMPHDIRVATIHHKPDKTQVDNVQTVCLETMPADVWIAYPHELSDLVTPDDPEDRGVRVKDEEVWKILHEAPAEPEVSTDDAADHVPRPRELLLDSYRLGLQLIADTDFRPDYLVALWPGGINAGLPVHELYKYFHKKGVVERVPDHISLNTLRTRLSYRTDIIGIHYLVEHINEHDNVLIIDTAFRSGQIINDVVMRLKEALRRNLTLDRIRVAAVYYNPEDRSTWTVPPKIKRPHYFVKQVRGEIIYPHSIHKLARPRQFLRTHDPVLHDIVFGDADS